MKIFGLDKNNWNRKINFVDKNNVFVGYDMEQQCCESTDWFISEKEKKNIIKNKNKYDLDDYVFDKKYFTNVKFKNVEIESLGYLGIEFGNMIRFKLISEGKKNLYLHIYNIHNGYYSHGFEFKYDKIELQRGEI
jgi:hypothetical protein